MRIRTTALGLALALVAGTAAAHDHAATTLSPNDPKAKEIASLFDRWIRSASSCRFATAFS